MRWAMSSREQDQNEAGWINLSWAWAHLTVLMNSSNFDQSIILLINKSMPSQTQLCAQNALYYTLA